MGSCSPPWWAIWKVDRPRAGFMTRTSATPSFAPTPLNSGHWGQLCLPSAWLMCEWRITRSCMYRSDGAKPRPKVLSNYGDPPQRKGIALKTHHAGLVICLIIFQLETHVETGKEINTTELWQWYFFFNADKSSYTCHNINSVITLITKCISA